MVTLFAILLVVGMGRFFMSAIQARNIRDTKGMIINAIFFIIALEIFTSMFFGKVIWFWV